MPRDAVSRTANVGTVGTNGLIYKYNYYLWARERTKMMLEGVMFRHRKSSQISFSFEACKQCNVTVNNICIYVIINYVILTH